VLVSTRSKQKGTTAEREVVRYLQQWWPAAERRALSGNKDKGDVAGIPGVVVEVKAAARLELAKWQRETLAEQENAQAAYCVLVVKRPYKAAGEWDAYMPASQIVGFGGERAEGWVRMDLQLAVRLLLMCRSGLYSRTTA
jgi:Holliday junction resolvase